MAISDTEIQGYVNGVFCERNTLFEQNIVNGKDEKKKTSKAKKDYSELCQISLGSVMGGGYV